MLHKPYHSQIMYPVQVNVWDCCNETEGAGVSGCRGRAHMAVIEGRGGGGPNTGTKTLAVHT